jgi:hypothetical protein
MNNKQAKLTIPGLPKLIVVMSIPLYLGYLIKRLYQNP